MLLLLRRFRVFLLLFRFIRLVPLDLARDAQLREGESLELKISYFFFAQQKKKNTGNQDEPRAAKSAE